MKDDLLLDDNNIVRETLPPVIPGSFSKKLIHQLGINLKTGLVTSPNNEKLQLRQKFKSKVNQTNPTKSKVKQC